MNISEKNFYEMNTEEMCQEHMRLDVNDCRSIELLRDAAIGKFEDFSLSKEIRTLLIKYINWANQKLASARLEEMLKQKSAIKR